jgi:hypothetical protein
MKKVCRVNGLEVGELEVDVRQSAESRLQKLRSLGENLREKGVQGCRVGATAGTACCAQVR